jgi:hypothetical protein
MDFVTIIFNHEIEIHLLKLQAFSFQFVEPHLISNILVFFNDDMNLKDNFLIQFEDIIKYYPENIKNKVKVLFLNDINLDFPYSNWFTQQLVKIEIAKKVSTKYYLMLDAKNHFIKKITKDLFFSSDNKPYMYFNDSGSAFNTYYNNCLEYFNVECPNNKKELGVLKIQTTTPFLFITQKCLQLIHYIEEKEGKLFNDFFVESKKYTEFYFYYSYLIYCNKHSKYENNTRHHPVITVGHQDPKTAYYNSWEYKKHILNTEYIALFSLHRNSISILDSEYKKELIEFYTNIYKDTDVLKQILYFLYN